MMPTPWGLSIKLKDVVLDFTWLSILLIAGTVLRRLLKAIGFQAEKPEHLRS